MTSAWSRRGSNVASALRRRAHLVVALVVALVAGGWAGCGSAEPMTGADAGSVEGSPGEAELALVDLDAFRELSIEEFDPFAALVPERRACPPPAYVIEDDGLGGRVLEVRTDVCDYITLQQASLAPIRRGDTVQLLMWHNTLSTLESAEAYAAIRVDGDEVWSVTVPIPSEAASYERSFRMRRAVPAGSEVLLHIHNHGANSWRFSSLRIRR